MADNTGKVVQVIGPVLDVEFEAAHLPEIYNALSLKTTNEAGQEIELIAEVQEACFWHLKSPLQRITGWDAPYPHATEWDYFPGPDRVARALTKAMED